MFYCHDCKSTFDDPKTEREYHGEYWGAPAYEEYGVCPNCKSEDIEEMAMCEICGEYHINEGYYCSNCLMETDIIVEQAIKDIKEYLGANHRDAVYIMEEILEEKENERC